MTTRIFIPRTSDTYWKREAYRKLARVKRSQNNWSPAFMVSFLAGRVLLALICPLLFCPLHIPYLGMPAPHDAARHALDPHFATPESLSGFAGSFGGNTEHSC